MRKEGKGKERGTMGVDTRGGTGGDKRSVKVQTGGLGG